MATKKKSTPKKNTATYKNRQYKIDSMGRVEIQDDK